MLQDSEVMMTEDCTQSQPSISPVNDPNSNSENSKEIVDLVGGPFAVIESDPGVFTALTKKLGVRNVEVVEMYDIEPWAVDHLHPRGLIFCFRWHKDTHRLADFNDPAAERVWFANQLSDDACASHAILNVLFNCPEIDIGEELRVFKEDTAQMSPVMKGLAISSSPMLRQMHNSLARPADIRGAINAIAINTLEAQRLKAQEDRARKKQDMVPPPPKRARVTKEKTASVKQRREPEEQSEQDESYHFIGYVPAYGKVWELDGLKSGPLEVGELPSSNSSQWATIIDGWMDVVRPALRMKMKKYGGAEGGDNIRFSLLAIIDNVYEKASDDLEFLKRERIAIERQLQPNWESQVDPILHHQAAQAFGSPTSADMVLGRAYAQDFGARRMDRDLEILDLNPEDLLIAWKTCIQNATRARVAVEDEITKANRAHTDHTKRTFDYEPFLQGFVSLLHQEGFPIPTK
ncbi:hypothetical protein BD779DRAFT_1543655 [Infundibulicybe gibba]|nr:hypothetical protein BD779DRAFT_1543655 [Infundibulicybe gibba]